MSKELVAASAASADEVDLSDPSKPYVLRNNEDCRVCGNDQEHRPACFKNEPYCSENCRKALLLEAAAEVVGDLIALEAERERDWHAFVPSENSADAVCTVCRCVPSRAHPEWVWQEARAGMEAHWSRND